MTRLLVDTSVLIKWFHTQCEHEVPQARALRTAHLNGDLDAHVLDLAYYELGNVLIRALGWTAGDVADQLDDLTTILGPPLVMTAHGFAEQPSLPGPMRCRFTTRRGRLRRTSSRSRLSAPTANC